MLQQTSLDAWRSIQDSLSQKQVEVFAVFRRSKEPLTNMEVASLLGWPINCVTPRVLELRDRQMLKEAGKKLMPTGRWAMSWKRTLRCIGEQYE